MPDEKQLQEALREHAEKLDVPGVSVGVFADGEELYAFHGITSVENPLTVDADTIFQFGSTGKTYTATAVMRLVEQGRVDLEAPVRTYVPELVLRDEAVAEKVTVLQLFNHTAGWAGDLLTSTGDGDDALEKYVRLMVDLDQVTPLGATVSYNNASLSLAGRLVEKVTTQVFEHAVKELLFEPLGLHQTYFFVNEIMTRRFAVGHNRAPDGKITVARPWALPRSGAPAGGISATARDQVAWARFHLGDGCADDGTRVLSQELLDLMKEPTVDMRGGALGDYVGISWLLRDVDGVRLVGHGGSMNGQYSEFTMVPEKGFAFICMTNSGPNGSQLNEELCRWALEAFCGVVDKDPEPVAVSEDRLREYAGDYETIAAVAHLTIDGGRLLLKADPKPEILEVLREQGEDEPEEQPPYPLGILPGDGDRYVVTDGPAKGMKGYFVRNGDGVVESVHVGGRLATRVTSAAGSPPGS